MLHASTKAEPRSGLGLNELLDRTLLVVVDDQEDRKRFVRVAKWPRSTDLELANFLGVAAHGSSVRLHHHVLELAVGTDVRYQFEGLPLKRRLGVALSYECIESLPVLLDEFIKVGETSRSVLKRFRTCCSFLERSSGRWLAASCQ